MNTEMTAKAKSGEELTALVRENGIDLPEAQAQEYFAQLHTGGGLAADELDAAAAAAAACPVVLFVGAI